MKKNIENIDSQKTYFPLILIKKIKTYYLL